MVGDVGGVTGILGEERRGAGDYGGLFVDIYIIRVFYVFKVGRLRYQ